MRNTYNNTNQSYNRTTALTEHIRIEAPIHFPYLSIDKKLYGFGIMSSDPWSLKNRNTGKYTELPFSQHDAEAAAHHLGLGLNITPAAGVS